MSDFVLVIVTVSVIAFLASWFPARKAAIQPVELKIVNKLKRITLVKNYK